MRSVVARPGFMINVARSVPFPDNWFIPADRILQSIACWEADLYADIILENPALICALAATIRPYEQWNGGGAVMLFMRTLEILTAHGPTTQSEFLLGFGFLPKIVRYVSWLDAQRLIVGITRTSLNSVLAAHPEWAQQLHEAGASRPPLNVAMQLRAKRKPQQYIIIDEDCEAI